MLNREPLEMEKESIMSSNAPAPAGAYSHGIAVGDLVFTSGQRGLNTTTGLMGADIEEQTALCLENINAILKNAGCSLEDVVKTTIYLADLNDFDRMNKVYKEKMPAPYPARTTVGAQLRNMLIEIDAVAIKTHK